MGAAAESLPVNAGPASYFNWSGELKALSTPGTVARVSHRGRRASVRREILHAVTSDDIADDRNPREEFEFSGNERTEVATDKVHFFALGLFLVQRGSAGWVIADANLWPCDLPLLRSLCAPGAFALSLGHDEEWLLSGILALAVG